jgi:hypothetical protein
MKLFRPIADIEKLFKARVLDARLAQLDRVPDRADAHDPLHWDDLGLPK